MPRKKKTTAVEGRVTTPTAESGITVPEQPKGSEETRCYQVTLKAEGGGVAGTERRWLTKKEALDLGFTWAEADPTKRRKKNTGDGS